MHAIWVLVVLFFVLRAIRHRHGFERLERRRWRGELSAPGEGWAKGSPGSEEKPSVDEAAAVPRVPPPAPAPQLSPVDQLQQDFVAGRITVEEYEAGLDRVFAGRDGASPASSTLRGGGAGVAQGVDAPTSQAR